MGVGVSLFTVTANRLNEGEEKTPTAGIRYDTYATKYCT